ncbi:hypothetical protein BRADI_3g25404v3 [Brachypodium distachyon]|uniref:Uncharacterized protein n=1 Tax=Brachypodium distachyon TaxID=15368 RepID=A0A0Q3LWA5_BRADI|nr:hypothetical protein BRADI_3g25404v3 [Brachypodium distachyon]
MPRWWPPGADLISSLPDGVLGEIIYLLPIKEGACTRILVHRWRDLWFVVPLKLDCCQLCGTVSKIRDLTPHIVKAHPGPVPRFYVAAD